MARDVDGRPADALHIFGGMENAEADAAGAALALLPNGRPSGQASARFRDAAQRRPSQSSAGPVPAADHPLSVERGRRRPCELRKTSDDGRTSETGAAGRMLRPDAAPNRRRARGDGQRHPHARRGRGAEGEVRPSRPADGHGDRGDGAVDALPQVRSRRTRLGGSRPLRPVGRPRLDAALLAAAISPATRRSPSTSIRNFRQLGSKTPGHPEYEPAHGIETTTGPLAQGLGNAVGMALAERLRNARWGDDIVDHYTYCIVGDGCLMEGLSQEAISLRRLPPALQADRAVGRQPHLDRRADLALHRRQPARPLRGLRLGRPGGRRRRSRRRSPRAIAKARLSDKPSLIDCRTIIGKGAPTKAGTDARRTARRSATRRWRASARTLDWPYPPFVVPPHIVAAWREAGARGRPAREAWEQRFAALPRDKQEAFRRTQRRQAGARLAGAAERLQAQARRSTGRSGRPARPPARRWRSSPPPSRR